MKKLWGSIIVLVLILVITILNLEGITPKKEKKVADTTYLDYTLDFDPLTNKFTNSETGLEIKASELSVMGISHVEEGSLDKITLNNVNFCTSKNEAIRIVDCDEYKNVHFELVGDNIVASSYVSSEDIFSGIANYSGGLKFSGTGSLDVSCTNNSTEYTTITGTETAAIHSSDSIEINGGTINATVYGTKGTAAECGYFEMNNGTFNAKVNGMYNVIGIYTGYNVLINDGTVNVDVSSSGGMAYGIIGGIRTYTDNIVIEGGDVNVKVSGYVKDVEQLKVIVPKYQSKVEAKGTTVDNVIAYIDAAKEQENVVYVKELQSAISRGFTGGFTTANNIKNAIIAVLSEVAGNGLDSGSVEIKNADVDIEVNGLHKNAIAVGYESGGDGLLVSDGATLYIHGDIDSCGISGATKTSTGILSESGKVQFDECDVNIELENSTGMKYATGLDIRNNNINLNTGAIVNILVGEGYGVKTNGNGKYNVKGGRAIMKGTLCAHDGNTTDIVYVSKTSSAPATDAIAVANDFEGNERVYPDKSNNRWLYKYVELGEIYDYSLYVDDDGKVYKNNTSGGEITADKLARMGMSTSATPYAVELTMDNASFVTSAYNAIHVANDVKVVVKDGTVNRITGTPDGSVSNGVIEVEHMTTEGSGTLIVDNRYVKFTSGEDSYKTGIMSSGDITNNDAHIILSGLDNCKNAIGIQVDNMTVNSGSINISGGYKTENVKGVQHEEGVFSINAGDVNIYLNQTSFDESTKAVSTTGLEAERFVINGGKVIMINHSTEGYTYGFYCNGQTAEYQYEQRGGVVRVECTVDEPYAGYYRYTSGIHNCSKIGIFDGTCEIAANELMAMVPVLTEGANTWVSVSKAKDDDGNDISVPNIDDIYQYRYILIEPNYFYIYEGETGDLYKSVGETYVKAEKNGWDVKLGSDGIYDLVLNGFHFATHEAAGILTGDDEFDIIVEDGSNNSITYDYDLDAGGKESVIGIYTTTSSEGVVNISGKGSLDLKGRANTSNPDNLSTIVGIWCKELNVTDTNINFNLQGPKVYATFIDGSTTTNNADLVLNIFRTNTGEEAQAIGLVSTDYLINDTIIDVIGGNQTVGVWGKSGVCNINDSKINVSIYNGGAIAGNNITVINDSDITFMTLDPEGASYGIYTLEDVAQTIDIVGSNITMDIVGTRCMGIKSSSDITLKDCNIDMIFDEITTGAAGIDCMTSDSSIQGKIDIDNCNIAIDIFGSKTTGDNQGIVATLGCVDIFGSSIKVNMDSGDGDAIHAGEYYSDNPTAYDGRKITLTIECSDIELDVNGKELSEECVGLNSSQGNMIIINSNISHTTNRASQSGEVMGLMATNDIDISDQTSIMVEVKPEGNKFNYVNGIYSDKGEVNITESSRIGTNVTGQYVNGIYANKDILISGDVTLMITLNEFTGVGMGVYSYTGTVNLDNIAKDSVINVKASDEHDSTTAGCLATMGADIYVLDSELSMDASGEDAYAFAVADRVAIRGGEILAKGSTGVSSTTNVELVKGDESDVDAVVACVQQVATKYKDTYVDDDISWYVKPEDLKIVKLAKIIEVAMYSYQYNATFDALYQVSYDKTKKKILTSDSWPEGLSVEDDRLVMKDFMIRTIADKIIDVDGDGTIYVEGAGELINTGSDGAQCDGIYCNGVLNITGPSTGDLKVNMYNWNDTRAIVAKKDVSITNITVSSRAYGANASGLVSEEGRVSIDAADATIQANPYDSSVSEGKIQYGVVASAGFDVVNTKCKVKGKTSAIYLTDTSSSYIRGNVKASTDYNATTLESVEDINTSYTDSVNKYKVFEVEPGLYSVLVEWGDLEYQCEASEWNTSTGSYDSTNWSTVNTNGDLICITNETADKTIYAKINYASATGYEDVTGEIRGEFDDELLTDTEIPITEKASLYAKLVLSGQLSSDATNAVLGNVSVVLNDFVMPLSD